MFINIKMATRRICRNSKFVYSLFISSKKYSSKAILKAEAHAAREEVLEVSTLFVPGRHSGHMYQIVKPAIDIDYIADNLGSLKLSCDHRLIDLDLRYTLEVARQWLNVRNDYLVHAEKIEKCIEELSLLDTDVRMGNFDVLNEKKDKLIEELITKKSKVHEIEDIVMPLFQKIPHILHPNTPLQFDVIDMCQEPVIMDMEYKSHAEIAKSLSLLEFSDNPSISYFLTGKLSELDFAIQMYFRDKLSTLGFYPISGMDFCKSFLTEAVGNDPYSNVDCIQIKSSKGNRESGQRLNLVGGASFETFCAYLTNMNVNQSGMPLRYFSLGRRYNAANINSKSDDLFSVVQSTNAHCIILSELSSENHFDFLLQTFQNLYSEISIPYRIVNIAAKNLTPAESQRKQLELWSPALKDYVPVAYVSQHDDFISKRLQITCGIQHIKEGYCNIVEGAAVNVPILIGCIIENLQTKNNDFDIPDVFGKYITDLHK